MSDIALTQRQEEANAALYEALQEVAESFGIDGKSFADAMSHDIENVIADNLPIK